MKEWIQKFQSPLQKCEKWVINSRAQNALQHEELKLVRFFFDSYFGRTIKYLLLLRGNNPWASPKNTTQAPFYDVNCRWAEPQRLAASRTDLIAVSQFAGRCSSSAFVRILTNFGFTSRSQRILTTMSTSDSVSAQRCSSDSALQLKGK